MIRTTVATAVLIGSLTMALTSASLPIQQGFSQATEWSWGSPQETSCDGFTTSNAVHSGNTIAGFIAMPVVKAFYPSSLVMVDQPGVSGCTNQANAPSYKFHGPEQHDFVGTQQDYSYDHATWFIGNGCDEFLTIPGCYKYEQRTYFYDSGSGLDPKFKTAYRVFGPGFADTDGYPQYHAYFRINADQDGSGTDYVQRIDSSGVWTTIQNEGGYFAQSPFVGTLFRVRDTNTPTQRLDIFVPSIDNVPFVTVLRWDPNEVDPTGNSQSSDKYLEPDRWANSQTSVNGQDIVVWYETYASSSATICQPDSACIIGPTIRLKGGL